MAMNGYYYGYPMPAQPTIQLQASPQSNYQLQPSGSYPSPGFTYTPMVQPTFQLPFPYPTPSVFSPTNLQPFPSNPNLYASGTLPTIPTPPKMHPLRKIPSRGSSSQLYNSTMNSIYPNSYNFNYDYDYFPTESTLARTRSSYNVGNSHLINRANDRQINSQVRNSFDYQKQRKYRTNALSTMKLMRRIRNGINQAGILFTAIVYSMCDCLIRGNSDTCIYHIDLKILDAFDESRLDLNKLMLPNDRLMTEESMENLEFELLEQRANRTG